MSISIPGLDTDTGLALYDDDLEIYVEILRSYVLYTPDVLNSIRNISKETLADYVINVHGIKSTSANIGAEKTREVALNLEKLAKAGDLQGVLERNAAFISETEKIVEAIKIWLDQNNS